MILQGECANFSVEKAMSGKKGFTLIEVIVVIAVVAILASILSPQIVKYISDSRVSRTLGDVKVIAAALGDFNKDLMEWPILIDPALQQSPENILYLLYGYGNDAAISGGDTAYWNSEGGWPASRVDRLEDHLLYNEPPVNQYDPFNWNGPYIQRISSDPWGNHYSINVAYLTDFFSEGNVVFVLSAGPNATWETDAIQLNSSSTAIGGDDIAFRIR